MERFEVYPTRWLALLLFCLCVLVNGMMWIAFAPVSDLVAAFFGVSDFFVDTFAVSWNALYLPGTLLTSYLLAQRGLRTVCVLGASTMALGGLLRLVGVCIAGFLDSSRVVGYVVCLLGQILAGAAQPLFLNAPALLAATWFGLEERDLATALASFCNPLGNALGQLVPPLLVSGKPDDPDSVRGLVVLAAVQSGAAALALLSVYAFFQEGPPTPPSRSTQLRQRELRTYLDLHLRQVLRECRRVLADWHFQPLLWSFGLGLCAFNSLMTLINKYVAVEDYSDDEAGLFGGILIICGLVGAIIAATIMEATRAYRTIYKTAFLLSGAAFVMLVLLLKPNQFRLGAVSFGVLGSFMLSLLPITIETAVECTYPSSEEVSVGLLFSFGNVLTIPCVFAMEGLIDSHREYDGNSFTPVNIFLLALAGVAMFIALLYRGQYHRLQAEFEVEAEERIRQLGEEERFVWESPPVVKVVGGKAGSVDDNLTAALLCQTPET